MLRLWEWTHFLQDTSFSVKVCLLKGFPLLTKMSPETVEWNPKRRDVKDMADQYALPVEQNDGRTPSQDRSKEIVAHPNTKVLNRLV